MDALAHLPTRRQVSEALAEFAVTDTRRGVLLFVMDFTQFVLAMAAVLFLPGPWLKGLAGFFAGIKLSNLVTLGHDAAHNMLTSNRKLNKLLALACFVPCLHNYRLWVWDHHLVHHPETNSEHYDSYTPFTKAEFDQMSWCRQLFERIIRAPNFIGFGLHYLFDRMPKVRIFPRAVVPQRFRRSAWRHFAIIAAYVLMLGACLIAAPHFAPVTVTQALMLGGVLPLFSFACFTGGSLYLMHTHPDIRWYRTESARDGDYRPELCATNLELPRLVSTLIHNVFAHSVHHVHAGVPCYNIPRAQARFEEMMRGHTVSRKMSLRDVLYTLKTCKLYDFEHHVWTDFAGNVTAVPTKRPV